MAARRLPAHRVGARARESGVATIFRTLHATARISYDAAMSDNDVESGVEAKGGDGAKESGAPADEGKAPEGTGGAGSKESVLADLKAERESRQALEAELAESKAFRESLTALLGGKSAEQDPKELAAQAVAERDEALRLNAVYASAPAGTDVAALLDSVSFRAGLAKAADAKAFVTGFVKDNPRYMPGSPDQARNLNSGNGAAPQGRVTLDDLIRGRR